MQEINQQDLAKREDIREHTIRGKEQVKVKFENIVPQDEKNGRDEFGDIQELALSILQFGLQMALWGVMLRDGRFLLIGGHRRHRAIAYLRSQGHEGFEYVDAIVAPKTWTETDIQLFMLLENNGGKPYTQLELARKYQLLVEQGFTANAIAARVGISPMMVGNLLVLDKLSESEKNSISAGELSATAAIALAKREADPKIRQERIKKATDENKPLKVKDIIPVTQKVAQAASNSVLLIDECLTLFRAMDQLIQPGDMLADYTFKIGNKLRELKSHLGS